MPRISGPLYVFSVLLARLSSLACIRHCKVIEVFIANTSMKKEINGDCSPAGPVAPISRQICEIQPSANEHLLNHLTQHFPKTKKPRRLVTRSGARVRGFHHSLRHGDSMSWETPEERALIQALDTSPATQALLSQSVTIEIESDEEIFEYTPDVAAIRFEQITVFECKPLDVIEGHEWSKRLSAIEAFFRSYDVNFIALPNNVKAPIQVQANIDFMIAGGRPVQYPTSRRKEDWRQINAARPKTFWGVSGTHRTSGCTWRTRTAMVVHQHERAINAQLTDSLCA